MKKKNILVIGGGTGTYMVLNGLKEYPLKLSVIVSMMDSGGSNRVIRDEFGLLPTSDIRQCIVALSSEKPSDLLRKLFTYRYNQGTGISGMTFGNLFMAALTDIYGSQKEAIKKTCEFLDVNGSIIPVTYEATNLVARYDNGKQVLGEHFIDEPEGDLRERKIVELSTFPPVKENPGAKKEILNADLIIMGPGDLYTSLLANIVCGKVANAIKKSKAKVLYIVNLMTRYGQTTNYTALDHIEEIEKYIGRNRVNYAIINKSKNIPESVLRRYREEKAYPVKDNLKGNHLKVIRGNFISPVIYQKPKSDKLQRSLVRHDPDKLAEAIFKLV